MEAENDPVLRAGDADAEEFGFDDPTERFAGESPGVTEATGRPGL